MMIMVRRRRRLVFWFRNFCWDCFLDGGIGGSGGGFGSSTSFVAIFVIAVVVVG